MNDMNMNIPKDTDGFPEGYPNSLKPFSWCIGEIAGPQRTWNKYCKVGKELASSQCFLKNCITQVFADNGLETANDMRDYVVKCFTIYFSECEFKVSMRKDKKSGERMFNNDEWNALCNKNGYLTGQCICSMLKNILNETVARYNKIMMEEE